MKQFAKLLKPHSYKLMSDGYQMFDNAVITAMNKIHLWDQMSQSYMKEINGVQYFISVGYNAFYFKSDGQEYCTHLHIAKEGKCYLHACLCSWTQKQIELDVIDMVRRADVLIKDDSFDFETKFQEAKKSYPWQTSN